MSNRGDKVTGFRYVSPPSTEVMDAFDSLPPEVRKALATAAANYNPIQIYKTAQSGVSVQKLLSLLDKADRKFIATAYAERGVPL